MRCQNFLKYFVIVISLFALWSCKDNNSKLTSGAKEIHGTIMKLPQLPEAVRNNNHSSTVVVYIDSEGCTPCKLKSIYQWKRLKAEQDKLYAQDSVISNMVFITEPKEQLEEAKKVVETFYYDANVVYDTTGYFSANNKLPSDARLHVFLLDKDNEVVLVGSPLLGVDMMKLYTTQISRLHKASRN